MAIEKITLPYEVLFRYKDGVFSGGHFVEVERIVEDGETLAEKPLAARPLDKNSQEYADIVANINTDIADQNTALTEQVSGLQASVTTLEAQVTSLQAKIDELTAEQTE